MKQQPQARTLRAAAAARAVYKVSCCLLALLVALLGVSSAVFSTLAQRQLAWAASDVEVTGISLKVYPMVGDGDTTWVVPKNKKSTTTIATRGGQLRIAITVERTDQNISETDQIAWADMAGFEQGFTYDVGDSDCISIDPAGVITALRDGTTTVTVTPNDEEYAHLSATVEITTKNQSEGLMVTEVEIVDEEGEAYGDQKLRITDLSSTTKLYVRVHYQDKTSGETLAYCNSPGADEDETPLDDAYQTLVWDVSDPSYASISSYEGVGSLKGLADGTIVVSARITGGDESVDVGYGEGVVVGTLTTIINTGTTVDGENPADSLTIEVVYEDDPDTVVSTQTYTPEEFEALGAVTRTYTLTRSGGKYVTDTAYGVPIATILLEFGIDVDDILYFTLAANDGANPGKISAKWLLQTTRYYLPNYDLGGSWQEKEQVPSMLALEDSWTENSVVTGEMNSGTRFRLLFGAATTADGATDKSIKFINTFTIVMEGSAPSEIEVESLDESTADSLVEEEEDDGGTGAVAGVGVGGSEGDGSGEGEAASESGGQGEAAGTATASAGGGGAQQTAEDADASAAVEKLDEQSSWRIYQMMNKSSSDLQTVYEENPLAPYLVPALVLCLLLAAASRLLLFKYEVGGTVRLRRTSA